MVYCLEHRVLDGLEKAFMDPYFTKGQEAHMRKFACTCGNVLYFENTLCLECKRSLGFVPSALRLAAFEPGGGGLWQSLSSEAPGAFRRCLNYSVEDVCNWMVPANDPEGLCYSCRLNGVVPNLGKSENRLLWFKVEQAKRRLLYTLLSLGLPIVDRRKDPESGLVFELKEDTPDGTDGRVLTGHHMGVITINIKEADPSAREEIRQKMNEKYRTLLGHFRHEIGHYYWDRVISGSGWIGGWREVFGDERADYQEALGRYYAEGPRKGWETDHISAYGTAHPWEDWCETFAHYLHLMDTMETAHEYGFSIHGEAIGHPSGKGREKAAEKDDGAPGFDNVLRHMVSLTLVMNALNRSMGMPDPYPFALHSGPVVEKLRFVHAVISEIANREKLRAYQVERI